MQNIKKLVYIGGINGQKNQTTNYNNCRSCRPSTSLYDLETYGRPNKFMSFLNEFRNYFYPAENRFGLQTYVPKIKKWKMGIIGVFGVICILTPCTNWMLPFGFRWLIK